MASTQGGVPYVQNEYTDNWTRLYPGQIVDAQTMLSAGLDTYGCDNAIVMGRGVQMSTDQTQDTPSQIPYVATAPFSVDNVVPETIASDLVGVAVRPYVTTTNIDVGGVKQAGYPAKDFIAVLPFGSQRQIAVRIPAGVAIVVNAPVYIALAPVNDAGIEVGEFADDSAGVVGLLLVPNAKWWINKTSTTNDDVGVIKLF